MKKFLAILLIVMLAFALVACNNNASNEDANNGDAEKEVLVMGTESGFAPFEYKEGDNYLGIDIEIAEAIAAKLDMTLEISDMAFDTLLNALDSDMVDFVAAGMDVTPEREAQVDFTETYFDACQVVVVKAENAAAITDVAALEGKTIAVQAGTTGNQLADQVKDATVSAFTAYSEVIAALENGTADAVIMDNLPAIYYTSNNEGLAIVEDLYETIPYAMAIKKGNTDLYDKINGALVELIEDGTVAGIIEKYSGTI